MSKRKAAMQALLATKTQLAPRAAAAAARNASPPERPRMGDWDTSSLGSLSSLTDLDDDNEQPSTSARASPAPPLPLPPPPPKSSRKRKAAAQTGEPKRPAKRVKKQPPPPPLPEAPKRPRVADPPTPVRLVNDVWSLMFVIMDKYAFVRLDQDGNPTDGSKQSAAAPGYWWPAKILSSSCKPPIQVQLFGDDTHGPARSLDITAPSEHNIVTMRNNSSPLRRFVQATFASPPGRFGNLCSKWSQAMDYYNDDIMGDDGIMHVSPLPMPDFSSQSSSPSHKRIKTKPKPRKSRTAASADVTIRLPGEKVLARKSSSAPTSLHWPALVQQFQAKGAKYELLFHDDTRQWVPRDYFYLRHEDGFGQCSVDMTQWGLEERNREFDDDDDDDDNGPFVVPVRDKGMPSPPPELPSLPLCGDGSDYCALPMRTQLALVEHILDLIINDHYEPAKERNEAFARGRRARELLAQTAGAKGSLTVSEQSEIREFVRKWALRDERWAKPIDDFGDVDGDADDEGPSSVARVQHVHSPPALSPPQSQPQPQPQLPPPAPEPEVVEHQDSMNIDADAPPMAAVEDVVLDMRAMDDLLDMNVDVDDTNADLVDMKNTDIVIPAPPAVEQVFSRVMRSPTESALHSPDLRYTPSLAPALPALSDALGLAFGPDSTSAAETPSGLLDACTAVDVAVADAAAADSAPIPHATLVPSHGEDIVMADSAALAEPPIASEFPAGDADSTPAEPSSQAENVSGSLPTGEEPADAASAPSPLTFAASTALPSSSQPASEFTASSPPPTQLVPRYSPSSRAGDSSPVTQTAELNANASSPAERGSETAASESASASETHVDHQTPPERVPHRCGYEQYENLSESERNQYCIDVLTYEAVIQVLLWRSGKRTTVEPLPDAGAEKALHGEGITLANTFDPKLWVQEIADRRRKKDQLKPAPRKRETHSGKELRTALKVNYCED